MIQSALHAVAFALMLQGAQTVTLPAPTGYVNDFANVLDARTRARLEAMARNINAHTQGDIAVVTLPDLKDRPVEEIALRIGREWKVGGRAEIGSRSRNLGVVVLIVPKETNSGGRGACRVETGQGAEGFLTDFEAAELCRNAIPYFQQRDYSSGVASVVAGVADAFVKEFNLASDSIITIPQTSGATRGTTGSGGRGGSGFPFIFVILAMLFLMSALGRRRRRRSGCGGGGCLPIPIIIPPVGGGFGRGGWGGGGFGGGFGGFGGGGGFSGGGGGSSW